MALPRASPNLPVSSRWWNALVAAIEELQRTVRDQGTRGGGGGGGDGIDFDSMLPATITAVSPAPGGDGLVLASAVQYTYQMRDTQVILTGRPEYGRPFEISGPAAAVLKVKPGAIGDRCWIVRRRNADGTLAASQLFVASEKFVFGVCTAPPPSPLSQREMERNRARVNRVQSSGASGVSGSSEGGVGA